MHTYSERMEGVWNRTAHLESVSVAFLVALCSQTTRMIEFENKTKLQHQTNTQTNKQTIWKANPLQAKTAYCCMRCSFSSS